MKPKLLIIDDDQAIHDTLEPMARELGFEASHAYDGLTGLHLGQSEQFSFVILDLGLPELGGIEVCRKLRSALAALPIILLTGRDDELSKVLGLELGADDYVAKPFSVAELAARVKAVIRRTEARPEAAVGLPQKTIGEISIDFRRRKVTKAGAEVDLSRLEFDLLAYLMRTPGIPISRDELMFNVWGYQCSEFDNSINSYLSRLRQKIEEDSAAPRYLLTVRGIGYAFVHPDELETQERE